MEKPAIVIAFFIIVAIIIFLGMNLWRYNWKNGELKTRVLFMLWAVFKLCHIISMYEGKTHGWYMLASLFAILMILMRHYIKKPQPE